MQTSNEKREIIESWIEDKISNVHTSLPGNIISYNSATNRAIVKPSGIYKTNDGRSLEYPAIYNVPVVFPTGAGAGITYPVKPGDGCLLHFSESQTDDFLSQGDSDDIRKHSLNDAICTPGLNTNAMPSNIAHSDDVCMYNGSSMVRLGGGGFSGSLADGTTFNISGGDIVVNGISLTKHRHKDVKSGGDVSGMPI